MKKFIFFYLFFLFNFKLNFGMKLFCKKNLFNKLSHVISYKYFSLFKHNSVFLNKNCKLEDLINESEYRDALIKANIKYFLNKKCQLEKKKNHRININELKEKIKSTETYLKERGEMINKIKYEFFYNDVNYNLLDNENKKYIDNLDIFNIDGIIGKKETEEFLKYTSYFTEKKLL